MKVHVTEHPFTTDLDISSMEFWSKPFVERDETFAKLRSDAPVSWHPPIEVPEGVTGEAGFWAVTRADDINYVSKHHELYSSELGGITTRHSVEGGVPGRTMMGMDPPDHTLFRNIMSTAFTPKGVARINGKIEERAAQIVSAVVGAGELDFVARVSSRLPMMTVADMVGVPESMIDAFTQAGNNLVLSTLNDADELLEGKDPAAFGAEQVGILGDIGLELARQRRDHPEDDLATALALGEFQGEPLTDEDIVSIMVLLSVAGNDTTKHTTTTTALNLCRNPDQASWLRDDFEGRIGAAVDEFVRHATPVMTFSRTAAEDTELGGQLISAGDKVALWYCSGNRDEDVFPDAHRFDLARPRESNVAFGGRGVHYCLGNVVAKAQLRAIFRALLTELPDLEVLREPVYMQSNFLNGAQHLDVTTN